MISKYKRKVREELNASGISQEQSEHAWRSEDGTAAYLRENAEMEMKLRKEELDLKKAEIDLENDRKQLKMEQ